MPYDIMYSSKGHIRGYRYIANHGSSANSANTPTPTLSNHSPSHSHPHLSNTQSNTPLLSHGTDHPKLRLKDLNKIFK